MRVYARRPNTGTSKRVRLSLSVITHATQAHEGMEECIHTFLAPALDGGEWAASLAGRFNPEKKRPRNRSILGCVRAELVYTQ